MNNTAIETTITNSNLMWQWAIAHPGLFTAGLLLVLYLTLFLLWKSRPMSSR